MIAGYYYGFALGFWGYLLCLATELVENVISKRALRARISNGSDARCWRKWIIASAALHAGAMAVAANAVAMANPGGLHFLPILFTFAAALYAATNNHQLLSVLAVRFTIYGASLLTIAGRELVGDVPPLSSPMWMQFACVVVIFYLITDCSRAYRRMFLERLQKIEELRDSRDVARKAFDDRNAMISALTHDLRTPLNAMLGTAQLLDMTDLTEKQHEYAQTIISAGWFMNTLLTDILDSEKLAAGKMTISPIESDLKGLLYNVIDLHTGNAQAKDLDLTLSIAAGVPSTLRFDPVRVMQVVNNLISNAVKFTSSGSIGLHASFRETHEGSFVSISVSDTGVGISEEDAARLFMPFEQAGTSAFDYGASGLGLWISRNLVHMMGGDIALRSDPGRGSVFTITFVSAPGVTNAPQWADQLGGLRVLHVEAAASTRQMTRLMLEPHGIHPVEVASAEEALVLLETEVFDVVLSDCVLPGLSSTDMVRRIRQMKGEAARVPIIAISRLPDLADRGLREAIGFDGFVEKPIDERALLSAISAVALAESRDRGMKKAV